MPGLLRVALLANAAVAVTGLSVVFGFHIFELDGRSLVPVAGMVIGNSMKSGVVAASRIAEAAADHRPEIEAGLALGMTRAAFGSTLRTLGAAHGDLAAGRADRGARASCSCPGR